MMLTKTKPFSILGAQSRAFSKDLLNNPRNFLGAPHNGPAMFQFVDHLRKVRSFEGYKILTYGDDGFLFWVKSFFPSQILRFENCKKSQGVKSEG